MPPLDIPKYEAFAQALAAGNSADKAHKIAGYKPNRGNAATLKANQNIKARVAEIVAERSEAVQKATGYKAVQVFGLDLAIANGSHDGVLEAELMARCLGYTDSPTLTHGHLNGEAIPVARGPVPAPPNSEAGRTISNSAGLSSM